MLDTTVILVVATTALSGIAAGTSLDVSIRQLPARHWIGVLAYSAYSQATDLGTAVFWYISVGVGAFLFALAAAVVALLQHVPLAHTLPITLFASLWVVHLLITLIWAVPTLPRQRHVATDEQQLSAIFTRFERLQTVRVVIDVLIFGTTLWARSAMSLEKKSQDDSAASRRAVVEWNGEKRACCDKQIGGAVCRSVKIAKHQDTKFWQPHLVELLARRRE